MKKLLALLLAFGMIFSFAACNEEYDPKGTTPQASTSQTEEEQSKYKVGDILDAPEKLASLDGIREMTVHEESFDKETQITYSLKRTENYAVYVSEMNRPDVTVKHITYQIGDAYTSYQLTIRSEESSQWFQLFDSPKWVPEHMGAMGFDIVSSPIYSTDGYKKLEDAVIDGKSYYSYEVCIHDSLVDTEDNGVIYVDKETGVWIQTESHYGDKVSGYKITSLEYKYDNVLGLSDPVVIPEQSIYDSNGITITAKSSATIHPTIATTLVLGVTNTTDNDIKLSSHRLRANGLYLGQNVVKGEVKANSSSEITVDLPVSSTTLSDVYAIKDMDTRLKISALHTIENPDGSQSKTETTLVEDTGDLFIQAKYDEDAQFTVDKSGSLVFDESDVKLTLRDLIQLDNGSTYFRFYVENDFSELIRIRINISKINGVEFEDSYRFRMAAASEGFNGFSISAKYLSEFENIETIEFEYAVYYGDMYDGGINYSKTKTLLESDDPITLTVKQ